MLSSPTGVEAIRGADKTELAGRCQTETFATSNERGAH